MSARWRESSDERGDRGVALLELALVLPLLLALGLGIVEMGLAWTQVQRVTGSVANASRVASSQGSEETADKSVLLALKSSLDAGSLENLSKVAIYRADNHSSAKSPCDTEDWAAGDGPRNEWSGDSLRAVDDATTPSAIQAAASVHEWPTSSRKSKLTGPPDSIGVCVVTVHRQVTHFGWDDFTINKSTVHRIAPGASPY